MALTVPGENTIKNKTREILLLSHHCVRNLTSRLCTVCLSFSSVRYVCTLHRDILHYTERQARAHTHTIETHTNKKKKSTHTPIHNCARGRCLHGSSEITFSLYAGFHSHHSSFLQNYGQFIQFWQQPQNFRDKISFRLLNKICICLTCPVSIATCVCFWQPHSLHFSVFRHTVSTPARV